MTADSPAPQLSALDRLSIPDNGDSAAKAAIKCRLDLMFCALEALTDDSSAAALQAAKTLGVDRFMGDRVSFWRLRNANPLRKSDGGRKKLDIDEVRALVLTICHLAQQNQAGIRAALAQVEAATAAERELSSEPLVADYLDTFHSDYRDRMIDGDRLSADSITDLAVTLLVDLMLCSGREGASRLWFALLARPEMDVPESATAASTSVTPGTVTMDGAIASVKSSSVTISAPTAISTPGSAAVPSEVPSSPADSSPSEL
ncbi:MAG: DUF3038 domain-containing protein [Cyanobacteria bacterium J06639_1]